MITLRMVAIALAILIGTPIVIALADDLPTISGGDPVQEGEAAVQAIVRDIELLEPPQQYHRVMPSGVPEQLVEGHTVFVTIEGVRMAKDSPWNVSIVGSINCEFGARAEGTFVAGLPWPTEIEEGFVRCRVGEQVFVSPDPFMDPNDMSVSDVSAFVPRASWQAQAPNGETIDVQEYTFDVTRIREDGTLTTERQYAWSVPIISPFLHPNGSVKDWFCPIPEERLVEMGKTDFWAYHESELPTYFWSTRS